MAGFGDVMKIFIGAGFPRMGFPGYIVCLYVVACYNVYFSLIIILMLLAFNLTIVQQSNNKYTVKSINKMQNKLGLTLTWDRVKGG